MLPLFLLLASTVRGPADVESLAAASDAVVHAQVVRTSSAWGKGGGQIFTAVVLRPLETWKGDPRDEITVVVPGGAVGDLSQTVQGVAEFRSGEEVVVFLRERGPDGIYSVERLALGKFAVGAPSEATAGLSCLPGAVLSGIPPGSSTRPPVSTRAP